jgi:predicted NBD/HSP70 family sugar kinase
MQTDLQAALGIPVKLANDANCFALAETLMGAGKNFPNAEVIFGVIMGTGVGGGLIVHNRIIAGKQGLAGEWGHNELEKDGQPCYCGKAGCVEKVISGPALEAFYQGISGQRLTLDAIYQKHLNEPDEFTNSTIERLLENFGKALSVVINILDPEVIIIGGGVGNIDLLYTEGFERVRKYVFNAGKLTTTICKPSLGDSAGVFGAALLWSDPRKYFTQYL